MIFRLIICFLFVATPFLSQAADQFIVSCQSIYASSTTSTASRLDGIAGWGTKLLPSKFFQENSLYQRRMKQIMNLDFSTITPYWKIRGHGLRGPQDGLLVEWDNYFAQSIWTKEHQYTVVKNGIGHSLGLLELRSSGTEANNYFYELAGYAYRKRTGNSAKRPQLLFFANPETGLFPYGGTSGRIAEMSIRYPVKSQEILDHYLVPSPQTKYLDKIPKSEVTRLKKAEDEAIEFIRRQVANQDLEIGGILLEPISVSKGIHYFRKEFLLRLRSLADELGIPIMADEIFTGGGRTGKFWAFQHYEGFFPDLISFGKGLELKGVGWIKRYPVDESGYKKSSLLWDFPHFDPYHNGRLDPSQWSYDNVRTDNTSVASIADVARAVAVIETIIDKNLVELAKSSGELILAKVRAKAAKLDINASAIQGIGLVFHFSNYVDRLFPPGSIDNYEGRVTPFLTTKESDWPALD